VSKVTPENKEVKAILVPKARLDRLAAKAPMVPKGLAVRKARVVSRAAAVCKDSLAHWEVKVHKVLKVLKGQVDFKVQTATKAMLVSKERPEDWACRAALDHKA
jgi:hypothetical protein